MLFCVSSKLVSQHSSSLVEAVQGGLVPTTYSNSLAVRVKKVQVRRKTFLITHDYYNYSKTKSTLEQFGHGDSLEEAFIHFPKVWWIDSLVP